MKRISLAGHALSAVASLVFFSGCGGSQAPGAIPQGSTATHAAHGKSWMVAQARGRDLLYVSADGAVNVYSYPRGALLGSLGAFNVAEGLCSDKAGHVFVTSFYDHEVFEYDHGGTEPIATLRSPYTAVGCAVDPRTGDVAVSSGFGVAVFPYTQKHGYRLAKGYYDAAVYYPMFCGYDSRGNLFVDGTADLDSGFALSELSKGGSSFTSVTLNHKLVSPGMVQWDGKHLAVGDAGQSQAKIYRFAISGSTGTLTGSTTLDGSNSYGQFWIQGGRIIGPGAGSRGGTGLWGYPKGGTALKNMPGASPVGATVSLK